MRSNGSDVAIPNLLAELGAEDMNLCCIKVPEILPVRAQFTCKVFNQLTLRRSTTPAKLWIVATYLASSSSPVLYAYWQGGIDGSLLPCLCTYVVHYIEDGVARLNVFLLNMQLQC